MSGGLVSPLKCFVETPTGLVVAQVCQVVKYLSASFSISIFFNIFIVILDNFDNFIISNTQLDKFDNFDKVVCNRANMGNRANWTIRVNGI